MAVRGPRLEFAVGAFLVLALASLLVLAIASTNKKFGFGSSSYELTARFTNLGQLRPQAPVKIGGVVVGQVSKIALDPVKNAATPLATAIAKLAPSANRIARVESPPPAMCLP